MRRILPFPLLLSLGLLAGLTSACRRTKAEAPMPEITPGRVSKSDDHGPRPVYPMRGVSPHPLARRLCDALHEIPAANAARCCQRASMHGPIVQQCVRTLSASLVGNAVKIQSPRIERCEAALKSQHQGCGWVGGPWKPSVPAACDGIIEGQLSRGDTCRSSLECRGDLHCEGAGASDVGRCMPPERQGNSCSTSVDQLATYTRQHSTERRHPECDGYCYKRKCRDHLPVGAACVSNEACGPEARCSEGRCVAGAHADVGQACTSGGCRGPSQCIAGRCALLKDDGESCQSAFECKAGCIKASGRSSGVCGPQCSLG